ncbi:unnamed protein product [Brassica rapa]|uniref:MD-2-related lipid-recognition domain-containing protein n=2 Tax=Brassica campestris TaxID=3711 RepID=A0A8D9M5P6_BRACM|nr:unnamed protein product [Brassica rapa]
MAISHALKPLLLLLLSHFFLPAALGASVNFTNCRVSYPERRVKVTNVSITPYPLLLRRNAYITLTTETNFIITGGEMRINTFSVPLVLNPTCNEFPLCRSIVATCPGTLGPMVITIPIDIYGYDYYIREYFAEILVHEIFNQTMCVTFRYLVRDPEFSTGIVAT